MPEAAAPPPTGPATSVKVLVTGSSGVGKTTFVRTLSEVDLVSTDREVPVDPGAAKQRAATVTIDLGRMTIDVDLCLHLLAVDGHATPEMLWEVVDDEMLGAIVLLDHHRPDSTDEALEVLGWLRDEAGVPHVVAVSKVRPAERDRAVRQARHHTRAPAHVPVIAVDARDREEAKAALVELFQAARRVAVTGA